MLLSLDCTASLLLHQLGDVGSQLPQDGVGQHVAKVEGCSGRDLALDGGNDTNNVDRGAALLLEDGIGADRPAQAQLLQGPGGSTLSEPGEEG